MGQMCSATTILDLQHQINAGAYESVIEQARSNTNILERTIKTSEGSFLAFVSRCLGGNSEGTQFGLVFELDSASKPTLGVLNLFLNGEESFGDYPFSGENFVSLEAVVKAATKFVDNNHSSIGLLISDIENRDFFIHKDYDDNNLRTVVFVRKPFQRGSLNARAGGNNSPNLPPSFCLKQTTSTKIIVEKPSACGFDWNLYISQATSILDGID